MRSWSPRIFVLEDGRLSYKKMAKQTRPYFLERASVVIEPPVATEDNKTRYVWQIVDNSTKEVVYRLSSRELQTAKTWVQSLVVSIYLLRRKHIGGPQCRSESRSESGGLQAASSVPGASSQCSEGSSGAGTSSPGLRSERHAGSGISLLGDVAEEGTRRRKSRSRRENSTSMFDGVLFSERSGIGGTSENGSAILSEDSEDPGSERRGRAASATNSSRAGANNEGAIDWFVVSVILAILLVCSVLGIDKMLFRAVFGPSSIGEM